MYGYERLSYVKEPGTDYHEVQNYTGLIFKIQTFLKLLL